MIKKKIIKYRCTALEKAIIKKKAANSGQSISSFCRSSALGQKIAYKLTDEELQAYQMLVKYHNNFTAISNLLKKKDSAFAKAVLEMIGELKIHLNKFK